MNTNSDHQPTTATTDSGATGSVVLKTLLAIGLGGLIGVGTALIVTGGDDGNGGDQRVDAATEATTDAPPESAVEAVADTPAAPAEERGAERADDTARADETSAVATSGAASSHSVTPEPDTDEGADDDAGTAGQGDDPVTAGPTDAELPSVVVGQDENGEDIVVVFEVVGACATTHHTPLDDESLSFIRWEFDAPGLAPETAIKVEGSGGFSAFTKVTPDRTIIIEQGISSYGDYPFPSVGWTVDENTNSSIDVDGSHTVDDEEGKPSETCLTG